MATHLFDTFNSTSGLTRPLATRVPETGGTWTKYPAGADTAEEWVIQGTNGYVNKVPGASRLYYNTAVPNTPDGIMTATVNDVSNCSLVLMMRFDPATGNRYQIFVTGSTASLQKVVAGVTTTLATFAGLISVSPANSTVFEFDLVGTSLRVYRAGVLVAAATDSDISAKGFAGLGGTTGRINQVQATDTVRRTAASFTTANVGIAAAQGSRTARATASAGGTCTATATGLFLRTGFGNAPSVGTATGRGTAALLDVGRRFIVDSFTETAPTVLLDAHTAEAGSGWIKYSGSGTHTISGGTVASLSAASIYYNKAIPPSADYGGEVTVPASPFCSIMLRLDVANGNHYRLNLTNATVFISKVVGGTKTIIGSVANVGIVGTLGFKVIGTYLTGFVNGTQVLQVTDSAISDKGYAGFANEVTGSSAQMDNLTVTDAAGDPVYVIASGSASGVGTAAATGGGLRSGRGTAVGTTSSAINATFLTTGFGSSESVATGQAVGVVMALNDSLGSAEGSSASSFQGRTIKNGDASAQGSASAVAINESLLTASSGVGEAIGLSSANASAVRILQGRASSIGLGTANGIAVVFRTGRGVASGFVTVQALAENIQIGVGSASGSSAGVFQLVLPVSGRAVASGFGRATGRGGRAITAIAGAAGQTSTDWQGAEVRTLVGRSAQRSFSAFVGRSILLTPVPPQRTITIASADRIVILPAQPDRLVAGADDRDRQIALPANDRLVEVAVMGRLVVLPASANRTVMVPVIDKEVTS